MLVQGCQHRQSRGLFFGEKREAETCRHKDATKPDSRSPNPRNIEKQPEGEEIKEGEFEIGDARNPRDGLSVHGMKRKNRGGGKSHHVIAKQSSSDEKYKKNNDCVHHDAYDVVSERDRAEEFPADHITKRHQWAIVTQDSFCSLKGPYGGRKNLSHVPEAMHVWIFQDLLGVIVDEAVQKGIGIGCQGEKQ